MVAVSEHSKKDQRRLAVDILADRADLLAQKTAELVRRANAALERSRKLIDRVRNGKVSHW